MIRVAWLASCGVCVWNENCVEKKKNDSSGACFFVPDILYAAWQITNQWGDLTVALVLHTAEGPFLYAVDEGCVAYTLRIVTQHLRSRLFVFTYEFFLLLFFFVFLPAFFVVLLLLKTCKTKTGNIMN